MSGSRPAPTPEATPRWNQGLVDPLTIVDSSNGRVVAEISQRFAYKGLGLAGEYARLIASAPELSERVRELREALEGLYSFTKDFSGRKIDKLNRKAEAALKPREGR